MLHLRMDTMMVNLGPSYVTLTLYLGLSYDGHMTLNMMVTGPYGH